MLGLSQVRAFLIIMKNYTYPLLHNILKEYESHRSDFKHVYLLACQHILTPQAKMFDLIHKFGIPKENIHIFGKVYSTNKVTLQNLIDSGFSVSEHQFRQDVSFDAQHEENCRKEFLTFINKVKAHSRIIFLDDGGMLLKTVHANFNLIPKNTRVFGIEQTSSGFRKLEGITISFPIYNPARSKTKLIKESPLIAKIGYERIMETINYYSINPKILIVGQGPIGKSLYLRFKKLYPTFTYDIANDGKKNIIDLILQNNINIVIGATGKNILDSRQIEPLNEKLKDKLFLISMSSTDREFETSYFRKNKINLGIHTDILQGNIVLVNNGFPVTFKGNAFESTPREIEKTIGLLYRSVLESATTNQRINGFIDVPKKSKPKTRNNMKVNLLQYSESVTGKRLATFTLRIPKFIWGHIISHRVLSRNSASSRAIPAKRIRQSVLRDPHLPIYFGENKPGMQSGKSLTGFKLYLAQKVWLWARYIPVVFHYFGEKIGIHKEVINRMLEPWLMVDIIVTATEWNNFLKLRMNEAAQPEIRYAAEEIDMLLKREVPIKLSVGQWHLPFVSPQEKKLDIETQKKISAARCARVSYSLFDGSKSDIQSDLKLCERLSSSGHWSPFEHAAMAMDMDTRAGNFIGWKQYRKEFENESGNDYR